MLQKFSYAHNRTSQIGCKHLFASKNSFHIYDYILIYSFIADDEARSGECITNNKNCANKETEQLKNLHHGKVNCKIKNRFF